MKLLLGSANVIFGLATIVCLAGAMTGFIIFAPVTGGAWALTVVAILALDAPPS